MKQIYRDFEIFNYHVIVDFIFPHVFDFKIRHKNYEEKYERIGLLLALKKINEAQKAFDELVKIYGHDHPDILYMGGVLKRYKTIGR